ncbi:hypothetical protein PROFUN_08663 [Planoprotostelium fungivorum]|uniref:Uncharacterized protein n=1 Tax=Planoprotostelium fungivorum TaxID=1890364 RepID=A0A2P6NJ73_9EUKA|nr:hypothetical protein PROFUN_08663 [Planoprotostelium fungivorum]
MLKCRMKKLPGQRQRAANEIYLNSKAEGSSIQRSLRILTTFLVARKNPTTKYQEQGRGERGSSLHPTDSIDV